MVRDYQRPVKRTTDQIPTDAREQIGERLFNLVITRVPSHWVRRNWLRLFGARIGRQTSIMMGTRVHGLKQLSIGDNCSIGFRCLLDARGELVIDDAVVLASDVQMVAGHHVVDSDDFGRYLSPIHIAHHVWIASRSMVLAGVPAKRRGTRTSALDYRPNFRPLFY